MRRQLVFLHGFMGHSSDWDDVRGQLAEFDSRANNSRANNSLANNSRANNSRAISSRAINIEVASDWQGSVQRLAESIEPDSIVVGYSMGARLALGVAIEFPAKCGGLIFVSGNPGLESSQERAERELADEQIASRIERGDLESFLEQWYQASVFESLPEGIRRDAIRQKLERDPKDWPTLLRINSVSQQPNYWLRLKELAMPTLVVAGQRDEKYNRIAQRFQATAALNHVKTQRLADCGHMVHREQPAKLVDLIRGFV